MAESPSRAGQLGTFAGVFTPSILTILGIILFLRLGAVVGRAGLFHALIIIGAANLISVLTSFSLAAIATNMKVRGGGDYYLISRTLGLSFGGAIGLVLFLAQSVSIAFYCIGFGESVQAILLGLGGGPGGGVLSQVIAGGALVFLFGLAWTGADLATKFQYGVMAFLVLALASFYLGGFRHFDPALLAANWARPGGGTSFWLLFALFFPAVTGFTQGVSMSGDLKDPGKSLPFGTFAAVALSIVVYFSVAVIFAGTSPLTRLASDYGVMKETAAAGFLIDAGVIAATLSSAMASFLGAPRILQSLASDKIFPFLSYFAKGEGPSNNPRRGVLLSFGIALATIFLGELDLIAGIVSMFFLISYGLLNYATYFEASAESPSFRPRFRWYDKRLSLAGALVCLGVMLAIDLETGIAAAAVLFAIFQYLKRTAGPSRWADATRAAHLKAVRDNLLAARDILPHPREWRPVILTICDKPEQTRALLTFSDLIAGNSGMVTGVAVVRGHGIRGMRLREAAAKDLDLAIKGSGVPAFPLAVTMDEVGTGLPVLLQSFGIGPVRANTVVKGRQSLFEDASDPYPLLRTVLRNQCNLVLVDLKPEKVLLSQEDPCIHVWWQDDDTSRLMLLLAYLVTRNPGWESVPIKLMAFDPEEGSPDRLTELSSMLEDVRIPAEPVVVPAPDAKTILVRSKDAALVFLPVFFRDEKVMVTPELDAAELVTGLTGTVALVTAAEKVDLDAEPDAGPQGDLAELLDQISRAENRVEMARNAALEAARAAGELMNSLENPDFSDPKVRQGLKAALAARDRADEAEKKALKEKAKLSQLFEDARDKGVVLEKEAP